MEYTVLPVLFDNTFKIFSVYAAVTASSPTGRSLHHVLLCSSSVVSSYLVAFHWSCLMAMYGFDPKTTTGNLWSTLVSLSNLVHLHYQLAHNGCLASLVKFLL